jgi:hypothetical protein
VGEVEFLLDGVKPGVDVAELVRVVIDGNGEHGNVILQAGHVTLKSVNVARDADKRPRQCADL